jgi:microfibrillar-associated protein 1
MSVAAGVSDAAITVRDKLRGKIGQTKVKRYWPGKAPEWVDDADEDLEIRTARVSLDKAFPKDEDGDAPAKDDRRLRRLAETCSENKEELRATAVYRRLRFCQLWRRRMRGRKLTLTRRMRRPRRRGGGELGRSSC